MRTRRRHADTALGLACIALSAFTVLPQAATAQDLAQTLSRAERQVDVLQGRIDQLNAQQIRPESAVLELNLASAYVDARYLFSIGSYDRAIELLLPIVQEGSGGSAGQAEATFLLAESLMAQESMLLARRYYEQLADDPTFGLDAARRRLEIALTMGRYDVLEGLYEDLERHLGGQADDHVAYVRGKALYFQERYPEALRAFGAVPIDSSLYDRARYLSGVCHARMDQLDRAHDEYDGVLQRLGAPSTDESIEDAELRALAQLARGRLHYETQDWLDALDAYVTVQRTSAHYPQALYEIAWTQIRQASETGSRTLRDEFLDGALNNLEILSILADNDSRLQARAALLRGDLLMRLERYDAAVEQFVGVADQYFPVELELRELRDTNPSAESFYAAIVNPEEGTLRLPVAARPWFDSDPRLDRALNTISDVEALRGDIEESEQLIRQLDAALASGGRVNAFPRLREGWALATEVQVQGTLLLVDVVDAEAAVIRPQLDASEASEYEALHRRRIELQGLVLQQPRDFGQLGDREQAVLDELNAMILEVHRTELGIEEAREDLEAIRELYISRAAAGTSADVRALRAELDAEAQRLERQAEQARRMREALVIRQVEVGVDDVVGEAERAQRRQFRSALAAEERFLSQRRDRAPSQGAQLGAVNGVIGRLVALDDACEALFGEVDRLMAEQTAGLRNLVERERANVEQYRERLASAEVDARATAGDAAVRAFEDVHYRFAEMTLRASLGVIDVSWQQKEVLTQTIEALFEERNESLRELDADFAELLEAP